MKPRPLSSSEITAICSSEVNNSIGAIGTLIAGEREKALRYYLGLPFGNEQDDRSQVIMTEVRDAIESTLPSLLKIFTGGDDVVKFEPQGPDDEIKAQAATDYVNYIFYRDNPGFEIMYNWFKDALLSKVGMVKWWWDTQTDVSEELYEGLDDVGLALLLQDPEVEPIQHSTVSQMDQIIDPMTGQSHDVPSVKHSVRLRRTKRYTRAKVANIPPEEILISRDATRVDNARFIGHRISKTVSELLAMGFDPDLIDDLPTEDQTYWSIENTTRRSLDDEVGSIAPSAIDPSQRRVTVIEGYYRMDADGDGIAELRQIWHGSLGTPILSNEMWSGGRPPFASLCPFPIPHRFFGLSLADLLMDLQLIKSTLFRNILDNVYLQNNQRYMARFTSADSISLEDLLSSRPGGVVRVKDGGEIVPLITGPLSSDVYNTVEYLDQVKENRSGVSRMNQGLDPDALNKTATGIQKIMTAGMERQLLIARIFAETGVKDLFRGLLQLICEHQEKAREIRLNGKWVQMDPREWNRMADITVHVGIGTGDNMERVSILSQLLMVQEKLMMGQNPGGMIRPKNIWNLLDQIGKSAGLRNIDPYFTDPDSPQAQQIAQQAAQKPPPEVIKMQVEQQAKTQELQAHAQIEAQKMQMQAQIEQAKLAGEMQLARERAQLDTQLAYAQQIAQQQQNDAEARNEAQMARFKAELDMNMARWQAQLEAATKIVVAQISAQAPVSPNATGAADAEVANNIAG